MATTVKLLRVKWSKDYKHVPVFASTSEASTYVANNAEYTFTDFSYQKRNSAMRVPLAYSKVLGLNYVMYQNDSEPPVFAFITGYEERGSDQTNLTIETDVFATYAGKYTVHPSFVEREHVNDDTIGLHTTPENLECGEYVVIHKETISSLNKCDIVAGVTMYKDSNGKMVNVKGRPYTGMYSGIKYYATDANNVEVINTFLKMYDDGYTDAVKCLFLAPKFLIDDEETLTKMVEVGFDDSVQWITHDLVKSKFINVNGYKPKNNKLMCYPYRYMLVANNNGGTAIYQYEHFSKDLEFYRFNVDGCITPGCSIRLLPSHYKGCAGTNDEEGLNLGKYPICNWSSDEYTNWLTQNSVNIGLNLVSGVGQIVAGTAVALGTAGVGGIVGGGQIVGGVSQIAGQLSQIHQMSFTPPQSRGNTNCGDVITASEKNTFFFYGMTIKDEYLKIIDEYFDMFGYKCGRVKVPNTNHRAKWWFTKTIDVNISVSSGSDIPCDDLNKLKDCYNNGLTFWKDYSNMFDYTGDNSITA